MQAEGLQQLSQPFKSRYRFCRFSKLFRKSTEDTMNAKSILWRGWCHLFVVMVAGALTLLSTALYGQQPNFVYTDNNSVQAANTVSAFSVGPNGALTPISGSPFSTGGIGGNGGYVASTNILVSPSGNILFVANTGSNDVSAFSINPNTGTLTLVPGSPFSTGGNGNLGLALSATPDGKFLMVGNTISANITVFSIAPNGSLTPIAGSPFTAPSYLTGTKVSPNGLYLAASAPGGSRCLALARTEFSLRSPVLPSAPPDMRREWTSIVRVLFFLRGVPLPRLMSLALQAVEC